MRTLALDLASATGWAVDTPDVPGRPLWGCVKLLGSEYGDKGAELAGFLNTAIALHKPELIVFERPLDPRNMGRDQYWRTDETQRGAKPRFFASYETVRITHGLAMVTEVVAKKLGIRCEEVHVQSWRAHFIGPYRKAAKERGETVKVKAFVIARCAELGWQIADNNAADAAGIWSYAKVQQNPSFRYDNGQLAIRLKPGKMRAA